MKIITNCNGTAKEVNPYEQYDKNGTDAYCDTWPNPDYKEWEKAHPPLPLIDQNGNEVKQAGEFEAEKIWQWYCTYTEKNDKGQSFGPKVSKWRAVPNYNNNMNNLAESLSRGGRQTRQVYRLTPPIVSNPGKGDSIWDSETQTGHYSRPVHHREMMYKTPSAPQPIEKESGKLAEKDLRTQIDNTLFSAYLVGAEKQDTFSSWNSNNKPTDAILSYFKDWQASQPNLISREAVAEAIEKEIAIKSRHRKPFQFL